MIDTNVNEGVAFLYNNDEIISKLIDNLGPCILEPSKTYFKDIIRKIISQQISVKAAESIFIRFHNLIGEIKPENICKFSVADLREVGLSKSKAGYVLDISKQVMEKSFSFDDIFDLEDNEVIEKITSLRGAGIWTAHMFLIFSLNRLNVLPVNDVGFQRAVCKQYNISKQDFHNEIINISARWGNYKTIAVWYLWESLNT